MPKYTVFPRAYYEIVLDAKNEKDAINKARVLWTTERAAFQHVDVNFDEVADADEVAPAIPLPRRRQPKVL